MAIHWQVKFRSLRANTLYTVSIYDDSYGGNPVELVGGANPFSTQEDDDDDVFKPVRTQSGYLRIVDTGYATDGETPVDWRDIIPTTDTDRPVRLSHEEGNTTVVDWIGFMQAQNFGARLYETPLEREFPIQCPLSVISREDVSTTEKNIRNFAFLLYNTLNRIPATCRPNSFVIQGGADALTWLLAKFDWMNFIEEGKNHEPKARYDYGTILEDMCTFWGWTARTMGQTLYLTCADDTTEPDALVLTYAELADIASGNYTVPSGILIGDDDIIETMFTTVTIGNIFASADNNDYQNRGPNKAIIKVDANDTADNVIDPFDNDLEKEMNNSSYNDSYYEYDDDIYKNWRYTKDVLTISRYDLEAECQDGYASFNILSKWTMPAQDSYYTDVGNVIHIHKTYDGSTFLTMETVYEHCFASGFFRMFADTYRKGEVYSNGDFYAGNPNMHMRLGIGKDRTTAKWWDGRAWQDSICTFLVTIGNNKPELFTRFIIPLEFGWDWEETSIISTSSTLCGRMFLDFLGTDSSLVEDINGEKSFDLKDFRIEYQKNDAVSKMVFPNSSWVRVKANLDIPTMEYEAKSDSMVKNDYSVDCRFGSNDAINPAYGLLMNADGSYMSTASYNGSNERPEVHLANRIVGYWATSKRRIECDLLTHTGSAATVAAGITPRSKVNIDGTDMHTISISRTWVDDVVKLSLMEAMPEGTRYSVTTNLTRITSNAPASVVEDGSLTVTLTPNSGHYIDDSSVVVMMGETDITSTAYVMGMVIIETVTGNVSITASTMFDAQVAYLQSGGSQYIDTQYAFTDNFTWEVKFEGGARGTSVIGGRSSSYRTCCLYYYESTSYDHVIPIAGLNATRTPFQLGDLSTGAHVVKAHIASNKGDVWVDGILTFNNKSFTGTYISGVSCAIFGSKFGNNDYRELSSIKMYYYKMWQGNTLVRDYIPVRKNGIGYMYDKVSGTLFGNDGTGTFTYGSDI